MYSSDIMTPCVLGLICVCAKSLQSCPTLCNAMDCSLPGFSVHGIFQARILDWVAISPSRGSSQPRDQTCFVSCLSCIAGGFFTTSTNFLKHLYFNFFTDLILLFSVKPQHESAIGIYIYIPSLEPRSHLPPYSTHLV